MTINEFIDKAIEGGWKNEGAYQYKNGDFVYCVAFVLLDPEAWKAVGKTCVWLPKNYRVGGMVTNREQWHQHMREMIDALAEGKTIEEFIATLH